MRSIPIVTKNLLIVNVVAFILCLVMGHDASGGYLLNEWLGLHFFMASDFRIYQLFTYMFMHGGWEHIIFNMFALWMFGCVVERAWGPKKFLFYYITCGVGAGLFQEAAQAVQFYFVATAQIPGLSISDLAVVAHNSSAVLNQWTTVGASGAIYAILLAFGMIYPNERIFIFPLPVPIKAKYFVIGYAAIELGSALATTGDGVAHIAHLGGMVFGFFMIRYWRKQIRQDYYQNGGYQDSSAADAFEKLKNMFGGKRGGSKSHFSYKQNTDYSSEAYQQDAECTPNTKASQAEIDRILDKIRTSGYDSLTKEEKQTLFEQSR